jgi:hypothetical protein
MEQQTASPEIDSGKAFLDTADASFDAVAEEYGVDEYGDEVADASGTPQEGVEAEIEENLTDEEVIAAGGVEEAVQAALVAPHSWQDDWKERFNGIQDRGMQQSILDMNKLMNQGFTQRMSEIAKIRRDLGGVQEAIKPHESRLQRAGIDTRTAVQRSLAWDEHIQRNPTQGILDMASAYGVDLAQAYQQSNQQQEYMTPTERRQAEQIAQLSQGLTQEQQYRQANMRYQQQQEFATRSRNAEFVLKEFINATDAQGNQLHPYIEHVAESMARKVKNGQTLEDAYDEAIWANKDTRAALLKQQQAAKVDQSKRQAQRVQNASGGIVSKNVGKGPKAERKIEDQVSSAYDKIANTR